MLRPWDEDDLPFVLDMYSRTDVVRWTGGPGTETSTPAEARERLARWSTRMAGGAPRGIWAVTIERTGDVVGAAMLVDLPASSPDGSRPPSGDLEIGWHLHPDRWGNGYATEAAAVVLDHARRSGLRRVLAVTHPDNVASQAVARRIGMRHEGRSHAYYDTEVELFVLELDDVGR